MKKAQQKKITKKAKGEAVIKESQMMVVLEDMRDDIKLIAESLTGTNQRLDRLENEATGTNQRLDRLEGELYGFKNEMHGFRVEMYSFRDEMYAFKKDMHEFKDISFKHFSNMEDEIVEIKMEIRALRKELQTKADLDRLEVLEERVSRLEERQSILRDKPR